MPALRRPDFSESAGTLLAELQVTLVRGVQGLIVGSTKNRAGHCAIALPEKCIDVLPHTPRRAVEVPPSQAPDVHPTAVTPRSSSAGRR
ncbi:MULTISPECIES: hypothetical protein [Pseudofrankia]|uniref:hypothetical protein n=1 Tax=Pseudofrankia TaxID=2994363 RepID=UPI000234CA42|nr:MULTISPECIES: hypothetical protein [Pseudofrankia]OHV41508.1 hypothetical protein BCD49_00675 [Pseudofrankia sp. EUN1h]